ncbi:hypothetical protein ACWCOT_02225 [Nonomuraea bangladeshensis]
MTDEALLRDVLRVATEHINDSEERLATMVDRAWLDARLVTPATWGPRKEFWDKVRSEISRRASNEVESVAVMTGMIANDTLQWAEQRGIPVEGYEYPFGLLVAWLTVAALKRRSERRKPPDDDPPKQ